MTHDATCCLRMADGMSSPIKLLTPINAFLGGLACAILYSICQHFVTVEPYMDELFHIPQAQRYCLGKYSLWDPKITTFPGLYLYSSLPPLLLLHFPSTLAFSKDSAPATELLCTPRYLRLTVLLLGMAIPLAAARCRQALFPHTRDSAFVGAMVMVFPLSSFYYFLYYTDTLSTLALLLCYWLSAFYLSLARPVTLSAQVLLLGSACLAIAARQTNAVWVLFIAGTHMLGSLEKDGHFRDVPLLEMTPNTLFSFVQSLWRHLPALLLRTWPLLLPPLVFVLFVLLLNEGGVVVGDKDHHRLVLHPAMPLHLVMATALLLGPREMLQGGKGLLAEAVDLLRAPPAECSRRMKAGRVLAGCLVCAGVCATMHLGCLSHPFLEADNRHLSFYVWRYMLSKPLIRLLLSPLYAACLLVVLRLLGRARGCVWLLVYLLAAGLTLLPAHLFELRYFTPGAVIALLNMPPVDGRSCAWSVATGSVLSLGLLYVFLFCSFAWPDGSTARFML